MATPERHDVTVGELIERCAEDMADSGLYFGHGTDNAVDEAAALVFALAGLDHAAAAESAQAAYAQPLAAGTVAEVTALLRRRIDERVPLPYLLKEAWFAGLAFHVDERVLIPRSPFAELVAAGFEPWLDPRRVARILELGTGSGCIAVALARAFPDSRVVATDLCSDALDVAQINVARHGLEDRIELVQCDLFAAVGGRFDLVVSNPPYVPAGELAALPPEYGHEPRLALASGADGLDSARRILQDAPAYLNECGWLALEVGAGAAALEAAFPQLGFVWPEFEHGGEGIALIAAAELSAGL